jgi:hypothetical protein
MRYSDLFKNRNSKDDNIDTLGALFKAIDVVNSPANTIKELLIYLSRNDAPSHTSDTMYAQYGDIEGDLKREKLRAEIAEIRAKASEARSKTLARDNNHHKP